jgi:hypothetical protein
MVVNKLLNIDNKLNEYLNSNKFTVGFTVLILTGYISWIITVGSEDIIKIFDNLIFKLILFGIITWVSGKNLALGVIMALCLLVVLQVISNKKLLLEIERENYIPIDGYFSKNLNCLTCNDSKSGPNNNLTNELEFTKLSKIYDEIINQGKKLVESGNIQEGNVLITSGLGRLQKTNYGELPLIDKLEQNDLPFYIHMRKYLELYSRHKSNPDVKTSFDSIQKLEKKLFEGNMSNEDLNKLSSKLNLAQLEFLEIILKYRMKKIGTDKVKESEKIIKELKSGNEKKSKHWIEKLGILGDLLL